MPLGAHRHGAVPAPLSRAGCSRQFGRASAPMIPQRVHTMRGPNDGTGTSSDHGSALRIARWWHCQQHTRATARRWRAFAALEQSSATVRPIA
jgi:hypothetical protein